MRRNNLILLVALAWIGMITALVLSDATSSPVSAMSQGNLALSARQAAPTRRPDPQPPAPETEAAPAQPASPPVLDPVDATDPNLVVAPYPNYTITQRMHGFSYGHAAVDLTAGKGAEIGSPVSGTVSQLYTDELGNPTLIIDNERYQVTLMHGDYIVQVGDTLTAGQLVGYESNNGNTVDWWGRSCRGRNCGYHSHLNIYDKQAGTNVDPLQLITPSQ